MSEWLKLILAVAIADGLCELLKFAIHYWTSRGKPECELCHKVRITRRTKDKRYWSCRSCRVAYYKENNL